jgi:hypothetical protein
MWVIPEPWLTLPPGQVPFYDYLSNLYLFMGYSSIIHVW